MRDYRDAKAMAQTLRQAVKEKSLSLTHSESLDLIAKILGFADWNVLSARIQGEPELPVRRVAGDFMLATKLPVVPMRDLVLFPQMTTPIFADGEVDGRHRAGDGDRQADLLRRAASPCRRRSQAG